MVRGNGPNGLAPTRPTGAPTRQYAEVMAAPHRPASAELHHEVEQRLAALDQRYTTGRRAIVDILDGSDRPLTVPELLDGADDRNLPASSAYRNLNVLLEAGVVHRVAGTDDHSRFELAEELSDHHHHLLCRVCGSVSDIKTSTRLERALADAARAAASDSGFEVTSHRIDLVGTCGACRTAG